MGQLEANREGRCTCQDWDMNPEIIIGPPGTGKTTTLIGMVEEELASGTSPDQIAYLSFTRRAAEEAMDRACDQFKLRRKDFPLFRTLHSLCFRALGLSSAEVLDGGKLEEFGRVVGHRITGSFSMDDGTFSGFEKGDRLLFMENLARVQEVSLRSLYERDHDDLTWNEIERFSRALHAFKQDTGLLDYTDMLRKFVEEDLRVPIDVLLVDEAQDLSRLQWDVVRSLARGARRVVVAGDDDQAIYKWAGADVETFVGMPGNVRVLDQSYRVPRAVQTLAEAVVGRVSLRRPKGWAPRDAEGIVRRHAGFGSVDLSGPDILILARNRYILRRAEARVRSAGYLYSFHGAPSIRPSLLEAVVSWERLRQGKGEVTADDARRVYQFMSVGKGFRRGQKQLPQLPDDVQVTMSMLQDLGGLLVPPDKLWYDALDKLSGTEVAYIRAALRRGERVQDKPRIRMSTIHGMKGAQANKVVLLTDMAQRTYRESRMDPDSEARVWYVAVTRAKEELHIVAPETDLRYVL